MQTITYISSSMKNFSLENLQLIDIFFWKAKCILMLKISGNKLRMWSDIKMFKNNLIAI